MNKTQIEWVKNPDGTQGYTWNPITGCLNNCSYCYARRLANGRLKPLYLANKNTTYTPSNISMAFNEHPDSDPFYPRFWGTRFWDLPIEERAKPRGIFVCDMSELFGDWIPDEWIRKIFARMWWGKQHRYYLLTKQPQNLIKWSPFPDNCWVGVTVTGSKAFEKATYYLRSIEAKTKYISFEPLLEPIGNMLAWLEQTVNWVIIGQQTPVKMSTMPKIRWVEEVVRAANKANIPVFLKDNLISCVDQYEFALKDSKYRQEMPE